MDSKITVIPIDNGSAAGAEDAKVAVKATGDAGVAVPKIGCGPVCSPGRKDTAG
jgi:hypothetical protein